MTGLSPVSATCRVSARSPGFSWRMGPLGLRRCPPFFGGYKPRILVFSAQTKPSTLLLYRLAKHTTAPPVVHLEKRGHASTSKKLSSDRTRHPPKLHDCSRVRVPIGFGSPRTEPPLLRGFGDLFRQTSVSGCCDPAHIAARNVGVIIG